MHKSFSKHFLQGSWALQTATVLAAVAFLTAAFSPVAKAQDQDDPPGRVARLGYMEGSISFQPAGENEWVEAVPNRPMTTGDKLWSDHDSRAEVQLGSAMIDLAPNTGFSFLNLDDRTIQLEGTSGAISIRVWNLDQDNVFEIDTPNQAFTVTEPGRYRVESSENGDYTVDHSPRCRRVHRKRPELHAACRAAHHVPGNDIAQCRHGNDRRSRRVRQLELSPRTSL